jgi:hypothetical protein
MTTPCNCGHQKNQHTNGVATCTVKACRCAEFSADTPTCTCGHPDYTHIDRVGLCCSATGNAVTIRAFRCKCDNFRERERTP